jgi:ATP-binding cassette subfamily F protein uup
VLDEPTNDLDLETLDLLQEVIADYDGTVLIVSHDRDFLDRTVTITLGLDGSGKVDVVAGGYADWEKQRKARVAPVKAAPKAESAPPPPPRPRRRASSPTRISAITNCCPKRSRNSMPPLRAAKRNWPIRTSTRAIRRSSTR